MASHCLWNYQRLFMTSFIICSSLLHVVHFMCTLVNFLSSTYKWVYVWAEDWIVTLFFIFLLQHPSSSVYSPKTSKFNDKKSHAGRSLSFLSVLLIDSCSALFFLRLVWFHDIYNNLFQYLDVWFVIPWVNMWTING